MIQEEMAQNFSSDRMLGIGLTQQDHNVLLIIKKITLSVDITLVGVTTFCVILLRKYKYFNERILLNLLLANLLSAISGLSNDPVPGIDKSGWCISQAFFTQIADMCKFMWVCALTVYLYYRLVKDKDTIRYEWLYIVTCWGVPILFAIIPLITMDYGNATVPFCWIRPTFSGNILRLMIYWIPVFGGFVVVMIAFIYMYWHAHKAIRLYGTQDPLTHKHKMLIKEYLKPLMVYAISIAALNLPQIINRILNIERQAPFGLIVVHAMCHYSYGIVLTTLFFVTNGRKSFTSDKFVEGFYFYRTKIVHCRKGNDDSVLSGGRLPVATPSATPTMARRSTPVKFSNDDDSGITLEMEKVPSDRY